MTRPIDAEFERNFELVQEMIAARKEEVGRTNDFPTSKVPDRKTDTKKTTSKKYPWDRWMNGDRYEVTRGVDFEISKYSFQTQLHNRGKYRDLFVATMTVGKDTIMFQFADSEEKVSEIKASWREHDDGYGDVNPDEDDSE